jgi:hypothetical protein
MRKRRTTQIKERKIHPEIVHVESRMKQGCSKAVRRDGKLGCSPEKASLGGGLRLKKPHPDSYLQREWANHSRGAVCCETNIFSWIAPQDRRVATRNICGVHYPR